MTMAAPVTTDARPPRPPGARSAARVLYVDASLGFGGAIKSLALTLSGLPHVERYLLTTQDPDIIRTWFSGTEVSSFRRVFNYRSNARIRGWLDRHVGPRAVRWLALKGVAVGDLAVTAATALRIAAILRHRRIDVVHLNNGFFPLDAFLAAAALRVPCVVHLRDFSGNPARLRLAPVRRTARVVAVSGAVARSLEGGPIPSERVTVIHDPVDFERVRAAGDARARVRASCDLEPHHVAVGVFGRVIPWKGQHVFVEALLRAMADEPSLRGVIVGDEADGDPAYFDGIRRRIRESGLADRFVLAGYRTNVEEYYAAMDVVVHCSVTPEPFGMVVPEAMAAGRAVIAADAGGPREVVTHGVDGLRVPPSDPTALAAAILDLARHPHKRRALGEKGVETVQQRFLIRHNVERVQSVYDEILGRS